MMKYRYSVLSYQPTLEKAERETFAVMVEGKLRRGGVVFFIGRTLDEVPSAVSDVSKALAKEMPHVLANMVADAVQGKAADQGVVDWIADNMRWNFQASRPVALEDVDPVYAVAFKLFARHVAGADELVEYMERAAERSIRPPDTTQRVGQIEVSAVPVPA
jgi:hypothetical protein